MIFVSASTKAEMKVFKMEGKITNYNNYGKITYMKIVIERLF